MSKISVDVSSARIPVLQVGYQGENEVTDVLFDISSWITEFGEGVAQLRVKRPGNSEEESYVLSLTITDGIAVWTVSETDTANKGNGKVQLSYMVGNIVKKAVIYPYKVGKSIVGADSPVDPFDSWIERSKAWAIGETLDGDNVPETDETYQNNAKYYAEQADTLGSAQVVLATAKATLATEKADAAAASEAAVNGVSTQLTTRMSAIETEQAVQDARMDTFTSLPEGSTSGNAELADIRVGSDGTTYDTAGNAVRGQIGELKSDLDSLSLIDLGKIVDGYYVSSGYGTMPSYDTYSRTDKINVENISKIAIYVGTNTDGVGGAFYSKNEESITDGFISGVNFGGHTIGETLIVDVPSGAKYFALSSNTVNKDKMFIRIVSLKQTLDNIVEKLNVEHISYDIDLGTLVDGFVNSKHGMFISASTYKRTDFIPIVGKTIMVTDTFNTTEVGFAFYDSYYQFISGFDGTGHNRGDVIKVEIPNNAKYFAYCSPNNLVANMKVSIFDIADALIPNYDNPIEYKGNDIVAFNKILCIGDSMTEGTFNKRVDGVNTPYIDTRYAYPTLLKAMTNRDITNMGSGGESTKSWYNLHKNDDLSGHDACIIALGINDGHGTSSVQTTSEERITALNNIIAKVKAENKGIKIFLSTIFNTYKASIDDEVNADIRSVANSTDDVYLVDMAVYGNIIKEVTGVYSDTATHLTAIGYRKLAQGYFAYISYIMSKNANDFAFVHFAGTDNAY